VTPDVAARLFEAEGGTLAYRDAFDRAAVGSMKRLQRVEWGVLAQLDRDTAFGRVTRLRNITIVLVLSLMLAIGLAAYLVGLTVVPPLERLVRGSARVARGDLAVDLPVLGESEVATLTASFNEMVRGLSRGRQELATTNDTLREKNAELHLLSSVDSLTGLHNRRSLMLRLSDEVERSRSHGHPFALLMIDVDHFKRYNDAHGHLAGDLVLRTVADVLKSELRADDLAARYGGEEFVVLLPRTDLDRAAHVAERLRRHAEEATRVAGDETATVTLSVGLSLFPNHASGPEALLREADAALYEAKRSGRNRVVAAGGAAVPAAS
jgi:diguanylate cyclase (GGDEF)-like protein